MGAGADLVGEWPLFGLAVRTPRLELRYPSDDDLVALARQATDIVAPDAVQPFLVAWNAGPDEEVRRRVLQYHWGRRGDWTVDAWRLELVVVVDGEVVGSQGVYAERFLAGRTVHTGSWLARARQGAGLGTEMRSAVLHLAFAGLGALRAETGAFEGNAASQAVTAKLGYRSNGDAVHVDGDQRRRELRFALDRDAWEARRRDDIEIVGLERCLPLFGLGAVEGSAIP